MKQYIMRKPISLIRAGHVEVRDGSQRMTFLGVEYDNLFVLFFRSKNVIRLRDVNLFITVVCISTVIVFCGPSAQVIRPIVGQW